MKQILALCLVVILLVIAGIFRKKTPTGLAPKTFVELDYDDSKTGIKPTVSEHWLMEIDEKFKDKEYDEYDNRHYEFADKLCNELYSEYKYWDKGESHYEFLSKLNDAQKIYFALINFEGQTNNGGVYQFLFNQPENAIVALEGMRIANLTKLAKDYEIILQQYFGEFETLQDLRKSFKSSNSNWKKRWKSFENGYKSLPHTEILEEYFYNREYKEIFHSKMAQFVIDHQEELMIKE